MISVKCECGYSTEVNDDFAGKSAKCPKCKSLIFIKELPEIEVPESDFDNSSPVENYETKSGLKTAKREVNSDSGYNASGFLALIDILSMGSRIVAALVAVAGLVMLTVDGYKIAGIAVLTSGLAGCFWVYFISEISRVIAQIEKNTRQ